MADLLTDPEGGLGDELTPDYLGRRVRSGFTQQPQLPVTGGPAVGAPSGPVVTGSGVQAPPAGGPLGTGPTETSEAGAQVRRPGDINLLQGALFGLRSGMRLGDLAQELFGGAPAGASVTPSGQLTFGAPESLREAQFGGVPDVPGGTFEGEGVDAAVEAVAGEEAAGGGLGGALGIGGAVVGAGTSLYGLINAIRAGDPTGIVQSTLSTALAGVGIAGQLGVQLAADIAANVGPWMIVAPAFIQSVMSMITEGTAPLHADTARDQAIEAAQKMPFYVSLLEAEPQVLQTSTQGMSDADVTQLYMLARSGVRAGQLAASPLAQQGTTEHGVRQPTFPGAEDEIQKMMPSALAATVHLQDELVRRGISPDSVPLPKNDFWFDPGVIAQAQSTAQLSGGPGDEGAPSRPLYDWQTLVPDQTMFLSPQDLVRDIGTYGGLDTDALTAEQDATLAGMQPGQYEAGLRGMVTPGSALGQLWASLASGSGEAGAPSSAEGAPTQAGASDQTHAEASSPLAARDAMRAFGPQDVSQAFGGGAGWLEDLLRGA